MGNQKIKYEIINELGILSSGTSGWKKAFTRVSWNQGEPKYDIRTWDANYETAGRGITLDEKELRALKKFIDDEVAFLDENK